MSNQSPNTPAKPEPTIRHPLTVYRDPSSAWWQCRSRLGIGGLGLSEAEAITSWAERNPSEVKRLGLSQVPKVKEEVNTSPKFPGHPTNQGWDLYDIENPDDPRPQKGASLLLINEGGVLILGQWYAGVRYWGYKPGIPKGKPKGA